MSHALQIVIASGAVAVLLIAPSALHLLGILQ